MQEQINFLGRCLVAKYIEEIIDGVHLRHKHGFAFFLNKFSVILLKEKHRAPIGEYVTKFAIRCSVGIVMLCYLF